MRAARARAARIFYSESESKREQIIRTFFTVSPFMPAMLSQRSLTILQGTGVEEKFYSESDLALGRPKFSQLRIPASKSVGAELKDQMNTGHVI